MEGLDELRAEVRGNLLLPGDGQPFKEALRVWGVSPGHDGRLPQPALVVQPRGALGWGRVGAGWGGGGFRRPGAWGGACCPTHPWPDSLCRHLSSTQLGCPSSAAESDFC